MKKIAITITTAALLAGCGPKSESNKDIRQLVDSMTVEDKVAQKIIMSFRNWCEAPDEEECKEGFTEMNSTIYKVINENNIGGVILFRENQPNLDSTLTLIHHMQDAVPDKNPFGLFMAIDQEGGPISLLPRGQATSMPSNMAVGAAYLATQDKTLAYKEGQVLGAEVAAVGFNFNMAPVVDVLTNPLNPIINVRAYSEKPETVSLLGSQAALGMASQGVIASMKHFPGHGDTETDSHYELPIVTKDEEEAYAIDLAPYKQAIEEKRAPDMIMTAHIQYPALDDSIVYTKDQQEMIKPATLSYKIQHQILRDELGYQGITISDALDMKGIANFFTESDAVIKVFQAGVDIALMPTQFSRTDQADKVKDLIQTVAQAVRENKIDEAQLDQSVMRILELKKKRRILNINDNSESSLQAKKAYMHKTLGNKEHRDIERDIAKKSITLLKNNQSLIPLTVKELGKIHIITPWGEQAAAMKQTFLQNGVNEDDITTVKMSQTDWETEKSNIEKADTLIVGSSAYGVSPVTANADPAQVTESGKIANNQFARFALEFADKNNKKTILVSMRSPHDVANYNDIANVILATYSPFGFDNNYFKGPSVKEVPNIIMGNDKALGKLPVTVRQLNEQGEFGEVLFEYGFSLEQ
ncbi:glycoside hydrolase family 3 protein [Vibrio azureus]|nr:glycoside hydrolase family 3 protein [Vibrio azureus]